jgi:hypothetical protein
MRLTGITLLRIINVGNSAQLRKIMKKNTIALFLCLAATTQAFAGGGSSQPAASTCVSWSPQYQLNSTLAVITNNCSSDIAATVNWIGNGPGYVQNYSGSFVIPAHSTQSPGYYYSKQVTVTNIRYN